MAKKGLFQNTKKFWPIISISAVSLIVLASGIGATFAWFSGNRLVSSSRVNATSGSVELRLQISSFGGNDFKAVTEAGLVQINKTDAEFLLPVSTADLNTFVYDSGSTGNNAVAFSKVENEANYYHGRVYLRAVANDQPAGTKMALYLNQEMAEGGNIVKSESKELLNAARLGISFPENGGVRHIFSLSNEHNGADKQAYNTVINGVTLGDKQVLDWQNDKAVAVNDPSVGLLEYVVSLDNSSASLPNEPLVYMELGRIYPVDVYFYLEGCDPDCSDAVRFDESDLHLAFYGVLADE